MAEDHAALLQVRAAAVLLDVEGTVGSKAFLADVLYPYARQHLPGYVLRHRDDPAVVQVLHDTRALSLQDGTEDIEGSAAADPVQTLLDWIAQDRKAPPLKKLQGLVWRRGFEEGAFQGHLFPDAVQALRRWHAACVPLAIYSSGSVQAQQLYFGHSVAGDIRPWLHAHFDTDVGPKVEPQSYARIAQALGHPPHQVLFVSDSVAELQAARAAGLQVLHAVREDTAPDPQFTSLHDFARLQVEPAA